MPATSGIWFDTIGEEVCYCDMAPIYSDWKTIKLKKVLGKVKTISELFLHSSLSQSWHSWIPLNCGLRDTIYVHPETGRTNQKAPKCVVALLGQGSSFAQNTSFVQSNAYLYSVESMIFATLWETGRREREREREERRERRETEERAEEKDTDRERDIIY